MHPSEMEPLHPTRTQFEEKCVDLVRASAVLGARLAPETAVSIAALLRITNSYYSNRIEGHNTHPADIERAMRSDFAENAEIRALQREARAHVEVQGLVESWIAGDPHIDVCSPDFLKSVHREFYNRVPPELRFVRHTDNPLRSEPVRPGEFRHHNVKVGRHYPPDFEDVSAFMDRFAVAYRIEGASTIDRILASAASHHRLMWIHPFGDGNGRVARLCTVAMNKTAKIDSYGLWSISRGLARRRDDYIEALAYADQPRRHDADGRGVLSLEALNNFVDFFLDVCLDQVKYMGRLLALEELGQRLIAYAALREQKAVFLPPAFAHKDPMKKEAGVVLREIMSRGKLSRGEAGKISGFRPAWSRRLIAGLLDEGLLVSDSPKGPVRLGFPSHTHRYLFPSLFPEG